MKHAISSVEFLARTKGFRHGSGGLPMSANYSDDEHYARGWCDGRYAAREYSDKVCKELELENPVIHAW